MASGRMVRNKICTSERVNALPIPARLLYTWMITHLDCEGRMSGNPLIVKQTVIPLTNYTIKQVDGWLDLMATQKSPVSGLGLIERYEINGIKYLWMPGFVGEQGQGRDGKEPSWKSREAPSIIPPPPNGLSKEIPKEDSGIILDDKFARIAQEYEANIGMITPMISQRLQDISDNYPEGWFGKAVEEGLANNKRNLKYVERILERWKTEGLDPLSGDEATTRKKETTEAPGRNFNYKE